MDEGPESVDEIRSALQKLEEASATRDDPQIELLKRLLQQRIAELEGRESDESEAPGEQPSGC
jgi:hypothetical protein